MVIIRLNHPQVCLSPCVHVRVRVCVCVFRQDEKQYFSADKQQKKKKAHL